jgi:hypothetical protein
MLTLWGYSSSQVSNAQLDEASKGLLIVASRPELTIDDALLRSILCLLHALCSGPLYTAPHLDDQSNVPIYRGHAGWIKHFIWIFKFAWLSGLGICTRDVALAVSSDKRYVDRQYP